MTVRNTTWRDSDDIRKPRVRGEVIYFFLVVFLVVFLDAFFVVFFIAMALVTSFHLSNVRLEIFHVNHFLLSAHTFFRPLRGADFILFEIFFARRDGLASCRGCGASLIA